MTDSLSTVQSAFEAMAKGDMPAFLRHLTPDVEWRTPGVQDFGGVWRGPEQVQEWMRRLMAAEEPKSFAPQDFIAKGDTVVVLGTSDIVVRSTGKERHSDWVHVYKVRDGKIASAQEFYDTALENQDFTPY